MFQYLMASAATDRTRRSCASTARARVDALRLARRAGRSVQADLLLRLQRRAAHRRRPGLVRLRARAPVLRRREPAPRGHVPQIPGTRPDRSLMQKLLAAVERAARASPRTTAASRWCAAPTARSSARSCGAFGAERAIRARRGVVLATGGFINDEAMLAAHAPLAAPLQVPRRRRGRRRLRHPPRHRRRRRDAATWTRPRSRCP